MSRPAPLTLEQCQAVFDLPVADAAAFLGVSRPTISKVLRAHGVPRWPYRKLRAQGRLDVIRLRRERGEPPLALPDLSGPAHAPDPPPHRSPRPRLPSPDHPLEHPPPLTHPDLASAQSHLVPDDETYIWHLLAPSPVRSPHRVHHDHPLLPPPLSPAPGNWVCDEQLSEPPPAPVPLPSAPDPEHPPTPPPAETPTPAPPRSYTVSTARSSTRAVLGDPAWSRGAFCHDDGHTSFAFLPMPRLGSSLSFGDPLANDHVNDTPE